jgi:hypothetical protein
MLFLHKRIMKSGDPYKEVNKKSQSVETQEKDIFAV